MMRTVIILLCSSWFMACSSESHNEALTYQETVQIHRDTTDAYFSDPATSPLPGTEAIAQFKGLKYFPIDSTYRVSARLVRTPEATPFQMPTTKAHTNQYRQYGWAIFQLRGMIDSLAIYRNLELASQPKYRDYLFIPFRDATSGKTTYGGGRYLDIERSAGDSILLDFNFAYNPYCVYNYSYSCPIPPAQNTLKMAIKAGEKMIKIPQP